MLNHFTQLFKGKSFESKLAVIIKYSHVFGFIQVISYNIKTATVFFLCTVQFDFKGDKLLNPFMLLFFQESFFLLCWL